MEIPVINRLTEFEANMNALHNPSFASQVFSVSNTFMKWSALILALIASLTTIVNRVKILIIRLQRHPSLASQKQNTILDDDDYDSETASSSSFSDEDEEQDEDDEDETATTSFGAEEDFSVGGSGDVYIDEQWQNHNLGLRRRWRSSIGDLFSWSELAAGGKSVVKLWDSFGLNLDFDDEENDVVSDSGNLFAIYDMSRERDMGKVSSDLSAKRENNPALVVPTSSSPAVMMSASADGGGWVTLRGWDARIGSRVPAILAEWKPKLLNPGGFDRYTARDDVSSALTVGDMRKVNAPLDEDLTETDVDTWWDADGVIVTDEYFH